MMTKGTASDSTGAAYGRSSRIMRKPKESRMSHYSQEYAVKSNAARAAAKHGLSRADLHQNEETMGWRFMIPDGTGQDGATEAAPVAVTTLPVAAPERASEAAPQKAPALDWNESDNAIAGFMASTVPLSAGKPKKALKRKDESESAAVEFIKDASKFMEPSDPMPPSDEPAARAATAKVARRTGKVAKVRAAKREKVAKVAKAPRSGKTKREGHGKFSGSPAFQGRRTSQGRRGVTDEVMKTLRTRWTPADEILKSTGWVSNTFRGVLGKFRRDGMTVKCEKRDGVTCYRIAA